MNKNTKIGNQLNDAGQDLAFFMTFGKQFPRVGFGLLNPQRQAMALCVNLKDDNVNILIGRDQFGWMDVLI